MKRISITILMFAVAWLDCLATHGPPASARGDEVGNLHIELESLAAVPEGIVTIGQIARVHGGDAAMQEVIRQLDIADAPDAQQAQIISRSQVAIRLQLAGIAADRYQLTGPDAVRVTRQVSDAAPATPPEERMEEVVDTQILDALRMALANRLRRDPRDLRLRLTQPITHKWDSTAAGDIRIEPYLPPSVTSGRMTARVGVHVQSKLTEILPVAVELSVRQEVARALRRIERGETFSEENVVVEQRWLAPNDLDRRPADVFGRTARRTIRTGAILQTHHVDDPAQASPPVVIRTRDVVRLVARKGPLTVVIPAAEALQQGREGEMIRVRNPQSKRVVTGRVISSSEVEVRF